MEKHAKSNGESFDFAVMPESSVNRLNFSGGSTERDDGVQISSNEDVAVQLESDNGEFESRAACCPVTDWAVMAKSDAVDNSGDIDSGSCSGTGKASGKVDRGFPRAYSMPDESVNVDKCDLSMSQIHFGRSKTEGLRHNNISGDRAGQIFNAEDSPQTLLGSSSWMPSSLQQEHSQKWREIAG